MPRLSPQSRLATHEVTNQPQARTAHDLWQADTPLRAHAALAGARVSHLERAGTSFAGADIWQAAQEARRDPPRLTQFDRAGRRVDEVQFNAGYHQIMAAGLGAGYASVAWDGAPGGHATHAAIAYMQHQLEPGAGCPMTMTYAAVPALRQDPELASIWIPKLTSGQYDPSLRPVTQKTGATLGMAMTEKQGGSDVRANTTVARKDGAGYRLRGHKWFCSAPMSDGFLTLAQTNQGLTCFLVPRWLEGDRNAIQIQRLKEKLGNHANASSEIEYHDAFAHRLGAEGDGVRTIIEMVHHTRLDTAIAPAALMRAALSEAYWWSLSRSAFQKRLVDQPLMRAVLADLTLDWEAALATSMFLAQCFDQDDDDNRALSRIGVALAKFLSNKRCISVVAEAMEVLGGMGYVEETPMPMLYREAPLNSIWEGSGNIICLDIMRTLARDQRAGAALEAVLTSVQGLDARYDAALAQHHARWPKLPPEQEARWFAESLATLLSAAVLFKSAPNAVADGFVTSRVAQNRGSICGTITGVDVDAILERLA